MKLGARCAIIECAHQIITNISAVFFSLQNLELFSTAEDFSFLFALSYKTMDALWIDYIVFVDKNKVYSFVKSPIPLGWIENLSYFPMNLCEEFQENKWYRFSHRTLHILHDIWHWLIMKWFGYKLIIIS